jgi:recombinational DNA repair protein (RecF pathway)
MALYRDSAVVLRTHKLGEADRIITLLTRQHGQVRAVARGVRKTTSRFGGRLEPFMHVDVQLAEGKTLDVVTQVQTIDPFAQHLGADYAAYTAGTAILETAERLVQEDGEPAVPQYQLLVSALRALAANRQSPGLLLDSFQLRSLAIAGYAPSFGSCARSLHRHAARRAARGRLGHRRRVRRPRATRGHRHRQRLHVVAPGAIAALAGPRRPLRPGRPEWCDEPYPAPSAAPALLGCRRAAAAARAGAAARRHRDGRQRPLGQAAGAAAHRRARDG